MAPEIRPVSSPLRFHDVSQTSYIRVCLYIHIHTHITNSRAGQSTNKSSRGQAFLEHSSLCVSHPWLYPRASESTRLTIAYRRRGKHRRRQTIEFQFRAVEPLLPATRSNKQSFPLIRQCRRPLAYLLLPGRSRNRETEEASNIIHEPVLYSWSHPRQTEARSIFYECRCSPVPVRFLLVNGIQIETLWIALSRFHVWRVHKTYPFHA